MSPSRTTLKGDLKKIAVDHGVSAGDVWVTVPADRIREALEAARAEGFDFFSFITCVDHLARDDGRPPFTGAWEGEPPRFEMVYELRDMERVRLIRIRAFLGAENPTIASAHDLFGPANWDEREVWDLFGIRFDGHPDLVRILLPDDWEGHPLRRDYPVGGDPVDFSQEHEEWQTRPVKA
ncbi:MAG TPA: NADH-quinone oxidoreductase subunit C [Candidatus Dormibacteraeota bacterium]